MFESEDWIHIEIGDTGDREFLASILQKYPKVDLFLDDGGHTMTQQRLSMEMLLPHVEPNGVFMCEDLSTSWGTQFNGVPFGTSASPDFRDRTMMGLVLRSVEWLQAGWIGGRVMTPSLDHQELDETWKDTPWWREFAKSVKHIHVYNQLVVYEKGFVETPYATKTVGTSIPYTASGQKPKVQWGPILDRIKTLTKSPW